MEKCEISEAGPFVSNPVPSTTGDVREIIPPILHTSQIQSKFCTSTQAQTFQSSCDRPSPMDIDPPPPSVLKEKHGNECLSEQGNPINKFNDDLFNTEDTDKSKKSSNLLNPHSSTDPNGYAGENQFEPCMLTQHQTFQSCGDGPAPMDLDPPPLLLQEKHGHDPLTGPEQNEINKFVDALFNKEDTDVFKNSDLPSSPTGSESESESPENDEEKFEVESILDYARDATGEHIYLVKWKGWDPKFNTWEPTESLAQCGDILLEFYLLRKAADEAIKAGKCDSTNNGSKPIKRRASKFRVPPDPRSLEERENEFYRKTMFPDVDELRFWQLLWENLILFEHGKKKRVKDSIRWNSTLLETNLALGIDQKLNSKNIKKLRGQLLFRRFDEERKRNQVALKEWESSMNAVTEGMPTISVENVMDFHGPPKNFTYVNDYVASAGINIPDDPPISCSCTGLCQDNKSNCCPGQFGYHFPYTRHRKLRIEPGTPIYECNSKCPCGDDCANRVVQDGRRGLADVKLCIFRTSTGCGWGVKTLKSIKHGSFVTLYVGEVIESDEAELRGQQYDEDGCTYLFDLDFNEGDCPYTVDAGKVGNLAHFINHSCDPNLGVFAVWVNCLDPNLPKIALFALRDIARGEELTFDYMKQCTSEGRSGVRNAQPATSDIPNNAGENSNLSNETAASTSTSSGISDEHVTEAAIAEPGENGLLMTLDDNQPTTSMAKKKKPCLCGSKKCRKVLF